MPVRYRLPRRLAQLYLGLILYGLSMALIIASALGNMPWDVLHQGAAKQTGLSIGTVAAIVGALVLLFWIPLRERPGIGTISNVIVISIAVDVFLNVLPVPAPLAARIGLPPSASCSTGWPPPRTSGLHSGPDRGTG